MPPLTIWLGGVLDFNDTKKENYNCILTTKLNSVAKYYVNYFRTILPCISYSLIPKLNSLRPIRDIRDKQNFRLRATWWHCFVNE